MTTTTAVKIIRLPSHLPLVVKNRSEAAAQAFTPPSTTSVQGREAAPAAPRNAAGRLSSGLSSVSSPHAKLTPVKDFNQLTIDTIGYILS
jgi:hypothetical protein